jgi:hypothetical protein
MNANGGLQRITRKTAYFKVDQVTKNLSRGPKETTKTGQESHLAPLQYEAENSATQQTREYGKEIIILCRI